MQRCLVIFVLLVCVMESGCDFKCHEDCTVGIGLNAVGFSFNELNNVVVNTYAKDNTFSHLLSSTTIPKFNPTALPNWMDVAVQVYDSSGYAVPDTTGDTLNCVGGMPYLISDNAPYDIEIIVPSVNRVYRYSKIILGGPQSISVDCLKGKGYFPSCSRYITSYMLNGSMVNATNGGYLLIYFQK